MRSEHDEAVALKQYLDILEKQGKVAIYSHIPHETYTTSWNAKRKNKAEGVRSGVPDYIIVMKNRVLFLELKKVKGGYLDAEQKVWLMQLNGKTTWTGWAKGFEEAKKFIEGHLYIESKQDNLEAV